MKIIDDILQLAGVFITSLAKKMATIYLVTVKIAVKC